MKFNSPSRTVVWLLHCSLTKMKDMETSVKLTLLLIHNSVEVTALVSVIGDTAFTTLLHTSSRNRILKACTPFHLLSRAVSIKREQRLPSFRISPIARPHATLTMVRGSLTYHPLNYIYISFLFLSLDPQSALSRLPLDRY